jgi:hypothetical protein
METSLYSWIDLAMNAVEIAALAAILWQLTYLRRDLLALIRVVRRMDRKTADTTTSGYRRQAELNEAPTQ